MIQRIFHTIGQGAFYSERHENINIVYDCGNWKNTILADKVVKQSFRENVEIDVLFISHFDYDHVSKIPTLKKHVKKIKNVVLPLLHDNEKILLSTFYRIIGLNILTLINNPEKYFGEETKIIYVKSSENNESPINDNVEPQNLDTIDKSKDNGRFEIDSGFKITIAGLNNWIFIPYNHNYTNNHNDLITNLKKAKFDISKLTSNPNYTLEEIIKDISVSKAKGGKIFKDIYDRLNGKINQNSMFLYSGPIQKNKYHKDCFSGNMHRYFHHHLYHHCNHNFNKVGCIYTGDGDLNIVDIKSIFKYYWENVGTIQIPHHGDIKSFNRKILDDKHYCCPISVGKNKPYGHPSDKVIADILSSRSCPIKVTEELNSEYIEIIE
jgi:hypothetical protein